MFSWQATQLLTIRSTFFCKHGILNVRASLLTISLVPGCPNLGDSCSSFMRSDLMSGRAYGLRFVALVIDVCSLESLLYSWCFGESSLNVHLVAFRCHCFCKLTICIPTLRILVCFGWLYSMVLSGLILSIAGLGSLCSSSLNLDCWLSASATLLSVPG